MEITYIFHSGFLIAFENFNILIDYYKDTEDGLIKDHILKSQKPLYILSSHAHADHFNPEILEFKYKKEDITYILSDDIKDEIQYSGAFYLSKGAEYRDENIFIKAYGSTDIGISFYLEAEHYKIFHAGDLNNWHWAEEAEKEESAGYEKAFLSELSCIEAHIKGLDILFFPIDPRLGTDYMRGAVQFTDKVPIKLFVPMHFGSKYKKAAQFELLAKEKGISFFNIKAKGDSIKWK